MQMLQDNPFEPAARPAGPSRNPVTFAGDGREYFRIWIVNVSLSLVTLGIYSAWAKVRRLNYFYRQTALAGSSFEYHGQPMAILKGRALAVVLLLLWNVAPEIHPVFFAVVFIAALLVFPWLVTSALRFRLHNSSYRGLRFSFLGNVGATAKAFYVPLLLMLVTFGLAMPYLVWRTKKYFFDHAAYGSLQSRFQTGLGPFFKLYALVGLAFMLLPVTLLAVVIASTAGVASGGFGSMLEHLLILLPFIMIAGLLVYIGAYAYIRARTHVLCWDGLRLDGHQFRCALNPWRFTAITLRNLLLTLLTLGLYKPFSDIQLARLLAQSIELHCTDDLSSVVARTQVEERAGGEETAEFFDMDIGL